MNRSMVAPIVDVGFEGTSLATLKEKVVRINKL
jgi:hypothetical protein